MPSQSNFETVGSTKKKTGAQSLTIDSMMREVMHTLGNLDFQHDIEMENLEASNTEVELKRYIKSKLLARHRERREPYVELLTELRKQQHRLAFVA